MNDSRPTVLLVDDEPVEAEFYEEYLGRSGDLVPVTALSGDEALGTLQRDDIDCLVSDSVQTSAGRSLVEVAKEEYPELPVLLYSGRQREEVPADVADAYLNKGAGSDTGTVLQTLSETVRHLANRDERHDASISSGSGDQWQPLGTVGDGLEDDASLAIIQALIEKTEVDLSHAAPLYDVVDPDALDQLVKHAAVSGSQNQLVVEFTFAGHVIRASGDGEIEYRELEPGEFDPTDSIVQ
jgi:CheY-like chemotaxis protein